MQQQQTPQQRQTSSTAIAVTRNQHAGSSGSAIHDPKHLNSLANMNNINNIPSNTNNPNSINN
jgi:hypothetical protein